MDDLYDFMFDDESEEAEKPWMCDECNMDEIDGEKTKCPRCKAPRTGIHHSNDDDVEYDENGEPIDLEHYEKYY
jgi:uncharacterized paraquat-inducible protein A